ncbi:MAG TPA: pitrilysin family protein [Spirochaetota bacterium]|nr:pitrilysin family protein [Spirochaetota bacterium]HON15419.1 pitrilysin family protein [Spirochaetota bacterium]HPD77164.1 pitrilysin family protein [Spirochaetota bacterium]HRS63885.1 pitrilysin family protein [Spirochaetota bacterium]HRU65484.1 pitrilysin family protein [Spirochaetota bacterium]
MKKRSRKALIICLLFLVALNFKNVLYALESSSFDTERYFSNKVIEKKLKNGITLLMMNRGYSPVISLHIAFKVGSVDESYNTEGVAHILEHMLFKGTDKIGTKDYSQEKALLDKIEAIGDTIDKLKLKNPTNSKIKELEEELKILEEKHAMLVESSPYDKLYSAMGGVGFNASTSSDMTGYYISLPADKIEEWANIESQRLKNPVFREYYKERNNVLEERLMRYGRGSSGILWETFMALAYSAHPYRHPVIGWESSIKYMSLSDVRNFYYSHYVPSRMTITIVGRFDSEKTFEVIKKYFEDIPPRPEPDEVKIIEPEQLGQKRGEVFFDAKPMIFIGWKKPSAPKKEDYAFDIISTILSEGKSSRLYRSLVLEKKLVTSIDVWNGAPGIRYDNIFMIMATPAQGVDSEIVEKAIMEEIENFKKTVSAEEIERARNQLESSLIFMLDSNDGVAHQLSYYQTILGDWRYLPLYLKRISSVDKEEIKSVMEKFIIDKNKVVVYLRDSRGK